MVVILFFTLWHCGLVFTKSIHVCNYAFGAHVIYAFGFVFKTGCEKVIPEPC
jgi:hypothetical protein